MVKNKLMASMLAVSLFAMPAMVLADFNLKNGLDLVLLLPKVDKPSENRRNIARWQGYINEDVMDTNKTLLTKEQKDEYKKYHQQKIVLAAIQETIDAEKAKQAKDRKWEQLKVSLSANDAGQVSVEQRFEEIKNELQPKIKAYEDAHRSALVGFGVLSAGVGCVTGGSVVLVKSVQWAHKAMGNNPWKTTGLVAGTLVAAALTKPAYKLTAWALKGGYNIGKTVCGGIASVGGKVVDSGLEVLKAIDGKARERGLYKVLRFFSCKKEEKKK